MFAYTLPGRSGFGSVNVFLFQREIPVALIIHKPQICRTLECTFGEHHRTFRCAVYATFEEVTYMCYRAGLQGHKPLQGETVIIDLEDNQSWVAVLTHLIPNPRRTVIEGGRLNVPT